MSKIEIGTRVSPYMMPVAIVGSIVNDRPNFMTVAWYNRVGGTVNTWLVAIGRKQYTLEGIREHRTFSLNIPHVDLVTETDYCGIKSGRNVDKSKLFDVFYGKLKSAPMIQDCPLCIEFKVKDILEPETNVLVLGDVVAAYTEERYLTDGKLDPSKLKPFVFSQPDNRYWAIGEPIADAFRIGKQLE